MKHFLRNRISEKSKNILLKINKTFRQGVNLFESYPVKKDGFHPIDKCLYKEYNKRRNLGSRKLFCYAPFTNIFFNTDGQALTCCFNHTAVLGTFPEQSLTEMWQCVERQKLAKHMMHNNLSFGCDYCYYQVKTGRYNNFKPWTNDFYASTRLKKYPKILEFELSNQCNLECVMCTGRVSSAIRKNRENLDSIIMPYNHEFVRQLKEFLPYAEEANFYGGEPFLINLYYDIWDEIIKIKPSIKVFLLTNGTVFNEKIRHYIEKGNFVIGFSLDALNKELYETIRKNANFDEVIGNIDKFFFLKRKSKSPFSISITPMNINWQEVPGLIEFANMKKAVVYLSFVESPRRYALWNLSPETLKDILQYYKSFKLKNDTYIEKRNHDCFTDLISQVAWWIENPVNISSTLYGVSEDEETEKNSNFTSANDVKSIVEKNLEDLSGRFQKKINSKIQEIHTVNKDSGTIKREIILYKVDGVLKHFSREEQLMILNNMHLIIFDQTLLEEIQRESVEILYEKMRSLLVYIKNKI